MVFPSDTCNLTLDTNTALKFLWTTKRHSVYQWAPYKDNPERFDIFPLAMCTEGLTERCYWEVEWCNPIQLATEYKGILRKAVEETRVGHKCNFIGFSTFWKSRQKLLLCHTWQQRNTCLCLLWLSKTRCVSGLACRHSVLLQSVLSYTKSPLHLSHQFHWACLTMLLGW